MRPPLSLVCGRFRPRGKHLPKWPRSWSSNKEGTTQKSGIRTYGTPYTGREELSSLGWSTPHGQAIEIWNKFKHTHQDPPKVELPRTSGSLVTVASETLPRMEFRFWKASTYSTTTWCRACRMFAISSSERKFHLEHSGHAKLLVGAYRELICRQICGVCGHHAKHQTWGIPFCSPQCVAEWETDQNHRAWNNLQSFVEAARKSHPEVR